MDLKHVLCIPGVAPNPKARNTMAKKKSGGGCMTKKSHAKKKGSAKKKSRNPKRSRNPKFAGVEIDSATLMTGGVALLAFEYFNRQWVGPRYRYGLVGGLVKLLTGLGIAAVGLKAGLIKRKTATTLGLAAGFHGIFNLVNMGVDLMPRLPFRPLIGAEAAVGDGYNALGETTYNALGESTYNALGETTYNALGETTYNALGMSDNPYASSAMAGVDGDVPSDLSGHDYPSDLSGADYPSDLGSYIPGDLT